jgi:hypothetical protein
VAQNVSQNVSQNGNNNSSKKAPRWSRRAADLGCLDFLLASSSFIGRCEVKERARTISGLFDRTFALNLQCPNQRVGWARGVLFARGR